MFGFLKRDLKRLGPGFVTGASDDDPSGIATYSQAGATSGYRLLWGVLFTLPLMIAVQELCARIALVTKRGLVANMKRRYGRGVIGTIIFLLLVANITNLGADVGMMVSSIQLLIPGIPFAVALLVILFVTLALQIFTTYATYAKYLKWLTISLFAYVLVAFSVRVDWSTAFLSTLVPHLSFSSGELMIFVALLGTTISPYLFFWQANQEVEEDEMQGAGLYQDCADSIPLKLQRMRFDVSAGMIFSNVVSWFIIVATAAVLFAVSGSSDIATADQAARVLRPIAGSWAATLFTVGIIGTGLLAVPIFSSTAAYALSEWLGYPEGLSKKWREAKLFYTVVIVSTLVGALMNVIGISPVRALIYAAVVNAIIAAPLIYIVLRLSSDPKIMGEYHAKGLAKTVGWLALFVMAGASIAWFVSLVV
ncbi:MAG: divalent metal cation transporter [bacterium]|nr:divalent metal cation transporter [bacterium]